MNNDEMVGLVNIGISFGKQMTALQDENTRLKALVEALSKPEA